MAPNVGREKEKERKRERKRQRERKKQKDRKREREREKYKTEGRKQIALTSRKKVLKWEFKGNGAKRNLDLLVTFFPALIIEKRNPKIVIIFFS